MCSFETNLNLTVGVTIALPIPSEYLIFTPKLQISVPVVVKLVLIYVYVPVRLGSGPILAILKVRFWTKLSDRFWTKVSLASFWATPPVRTGTFLEEIPERPRKRSQSVSWNSPREYGWDAPSPIIQGI